MANVAKVVQTRSKFWVLYELTSHDAVIRAVCKTKREAHKLKDQNKKFERTWIDCAYLYMQN